MRRRLLYGKEESECTCESVGSCFNVIIYEELDPESQISANTQVPIPEYIIPYTGDSADVGEVIICGGTNCNCLDFRVVGDTIGSNLISCNREGNLITITADENPYTTDFYNEYYVEFYNTSSSETCEDEPFVQWIGITLQANPGGGGGCTCDYYNCSATTLQTTLDAYGNRVLGFSSDCECYDAFFSPGGYNNGVFSVENDYDNNKYYTYLSATTNPSVSARTQELTFHICDHSRVVTLTQDSAMWEAVEFQNDTGCEIWFPSGCTFIVHSVDIDPDSVSGGVVTITDDNLAGPFYQGNRCYYQCLPSFSGDINQYFACTITFEVIDANGQFIDSYGDFTFVNHKIL